MSQTTDFLSPDANIFELHQTLETSGARRAHVFTLDDAIHLAVPQLAEDILDRPANMNGGNADVDALLYRWEGGRFVDDGRLPCPGGEDALCFSNAEGTFLAFANLRTGSGPYQANIGSLIYRRADSGWELDESIPSFGAKQWHHFTIGDREFLALAQGLVIPNVPIAPLGHGRSVVFERVGGAWKEFQVIGGRFGYNWHDFEIEGVHFLGYADQASPSLIYRWDGTRFIPYQTFAEIGGRAFRFFTHEGEKWLAFAAIADESTLYRWNGELFVRHQSLGGQGGREFELIESEHGLFLVRVCFIAGSPADPKTDLTSQLFKWTDGKFECAEEFPTFGGTSASHFVADGSDYLAVSNSLTPEVRFRQDMVIYKLSLDRA